ncbi:queuosine precursor transporter [Mycoplasmatota bacterium]|nr:queuosine precursor transporter [Mycoplasmatota bacterium]
MNNELLWVSWIIINFVLITVSYKLFGKTGLFIWIAFGTVLANIQVTKNIELFGFEATLGNIMYGTLFLVTDSLGELYGYNESKKAVQIGFFTLISMVIIMQVALLFTPTTWDEGHSALSYTFGLIPRIALGSVIAYLISQFLDINLFIKFKNKFPSDKYLWLRNNGSTIISQFVDTIIFVPIAFLGVYDFNIVTSIFFTTYFIKVLVAFSDTPFIYLIKKIKPLR